MINLSNNPKKVYSLEEADLIINDIKTREPLGYSLFEWILLILYADKNYPIFDRKRFMNEILLLFQEVIPQENAPSISFMTDKSGVRSHEIAMVVDDLYFTGYICISGRKNSNKEQIKISDKGCSYIAQRFEQLPSGLRLVLKQKRLEWDTLSIKGLWYYTLTHYPQYAPIKQKIKQHVPLADWDKITGKRKHETD